MSSRSLARLFIVGFFFAVALPAFHQETFGTAISDIGSHFSLNEAATRSLEPAVNYSVLYLAVRGLWMAGANKLIMGWIAIVALTACVAFKGVVTFNVLSQNQRNLTPAVCVTLALAFVMPILNWWNYTSVYLGQIAPTFWHNPTTIIVAPLVVIVFYASVKCLATPTLRNVAVASGLCVLSTLIKPSHVIALLPALVPWFYVRASKAGLPSRRLIVQVAILVGPTLFVLLAQSYLIFGVQNTTIILAPFVVWSLYSPHLFASLLLSIAFPLSVLIFYRDCWRGNIALILSWLVFAVALAEFILLAEDGPRLSHANFLWGPGLALFVVFVTSADVVLRQPVSIRQAPIFALLALHVASGLYFYWRIATGLGYM